MSDSQRTLATLTEVERTLAMKHFSILRPVLEEGVSQTEVARLHHLPLRTIQRWMSQYRRNGLVGLVRQERADRGARRGLPADLVHLIEGLALQKPKRSAAAIHRQITKIAAEQGWKPPSYSRVYDIIHKLDPALVTLAPSVDETNLLYFIFPPTSTEIKDGDYSTKSPDPNKRICGYHSSGKFNDASQNDDLFWAIVGTDKANQSTGKKFANSVASCISHELAEAFTDRDNQGYIADNHCEIGDICESKAGSTAIITFQYRGWLVEPYWSNWDSACIQGDQPVSLRKFLGSIGFNVSQGLRSLNTPVINLQYMASRE